VEKVPNMTYRIRKNSLIEDLYLDRHGRWTTWEKAATFRSVDALEKFAAKCGVDVYGIF